MGGESNTQTPGRDVKSNEVRSGADQFGSREQSSRAEDATPGERVQLEKWRAWNTEKRILLAP